MKITEWHVNTFLTHLLDNNPPLEPLTWKATLTALDRACADEVSGVFLWPGNDPVRTLTEDSVNMVATVLLRGLRLDDVAINYRFQRENGGGVRRIFDEMVYRSYETASSDSEVVHLLSAVAEVAKPRQRSSAA